MSMPAVCRMQGLHPLVFNVRMLVFFCCCPQHFQCSFCNFDGEEARTLVTHLVPLLQHLMAAYLCLPQYSDNCSTDVWATAGL